MKATGLALVQDRDTQLMWVKQNQKVEILFAAEPMGDFVFPSVVGYTDVLEVSFTLFPWSETLWSMLAVSSRPPGNTQVACVPLAGH